MSAPAPLAHVVRSGLIESVHVGSVVVADADGRVVAWAGDRAHQVFARSTVKPLQAAVALSRMDDDVPDDLLALMCGSHSAEAVHLRGVRRLLRRSSLAASDLRCPPSLPARRGDASRVAHAAPIFHNGSGKHAGMLAACVDRGWDTASYLRPSHPLQRAIARAMRAATGVDPAIGVDGCGVPTFGVPLVALATAFARIGTPDRLGDLAPHLARATAAMRAHPLLVAGSGRADTLLMDVVPGLVTKVGAEGVHCAALPDRGLGIAVKVADGADRAAAPTLIRVLETLDALPSRARRPLAATARPAVLGGGRPVGAVEPVVTLTSRTIGA